MCHVLVIEDDWMIADYVSRLLESAGASSVSIAATETDAISAAHARPPALIISDVQLAEGTGPNAVQAIIADLGAIPVIYVTGTPEACQPNAPGTAVLGKPVNDRTLAATFRQMAPLPPA